MSENIFDMIMSFGDAAKRWGLDDSTLRRAVMTGRLKEGIEVKKYGKQWVITKEAMYSHYGEPPSDK